MDKINSRTSQPVFYCDTHAEARKQHKRKYYARHKDEHNRKCLIRYHSLRQSVITMYGGQCACCGENENAFLALDHINGDGQKHRSERGSYGVLKDALGSYDSSRFRILCHNCNMAMGLYGACPHNKLASVKR